MDIKKNSAKITLLQVVILLLVLAGIIFLQKENIDKLYMSGEISRIGWIINGVIIALFVFGMIRITMTLLRYIREHSILVQLVDNLNVDAKEPIKSLPGDSLAVQRYKAIALITSQHGDINQAALAASCDASENSKLTLIRFVHSTLILAGVFGTVVSLSMALIGASGLLSSAQGVAEMGAVISGMSSALSSTITAILCFFIFAYFYLRLNDSRVQLLNQVEAVTSVYLLPGRHQNEQTMIRYVADLTLALKEAASRIMEVQEKFIAVGDELHTAVDRLQGEVSHNSLEEIKDLIRKGFHLSEPEYIAPQPEHDRETPDETLLRENKGILEGLKSKVGR